MNKFHNKWILLFPILILLTSCAGKYPEPVLSKAEPNHFEVEALCSVEEVFQGAQGSWTAGTSRFFYGATDNGLEIWQYNLEKCTLTKNILAMEDMSFLKGNETGQRILCKSVQSDTDDGSYYFCDYDSEGILQNKRNITEALNAVSQKYPYCWNRMESPDGKLILFCEDNKERNYVLVVSDAGEMENCIKYGADGVRDWMLTGDDKMLLIANYQTSLSNSLFELDFSNGECRQLVKNLPGSEEAISCQFVKSQDTQNVYYQTDDAVWKYDFDKHEVSKEISFLDVSLDGRFVNAMMQEADGSWRALWVNREGGTFDFIRLRKTVEKAEKDSRVELIYAVVGPKQVYTSDVSMFNSSHAKTKVIIKEYEEAEQLLTDLIAGKPMDLVDLGNESLYSVLERKGLLEDLAQYLLQDPNLSESDFLPAALEIYANGGKVYAIPYSVSLHVMMCDTPRIQNRESWDFSDFRDFLMDLPDREKALRGSNNQDILNNLCMQYMDHFIDGKAKYCNFMTDEFYDFLEVSSFFPDFDGSEDAWNIIMKGFEDGENVLACVNIGDFNSYEYYRSLFAGKGKIMGYPNDNGNGVGIQNGSYSAPAIMANCQHKEEAWEFIKSTLIKNTETLHMPVFVSYLPSLDKIMNELEERAQSKEALETTTPPVTGSEIRMIRELLEGADAIQAGDADILEIISEETGAYFAGQKNAETTAEVIQNRVTLYLNEK